MKAGLLVAVLLVAAVAPGSVWCDYHNVYAFWAGTEYPSGKCYDVFKHGYGSTEHKLVSPCK